ncbi:MAG TPA: signal peptidase I [Candidatus Angelobacter sp.]|jgi:signal peptidase I
MIDPEQSPPEEPRTDPPDTAAIEPAQPSAATEQSAAEQPASAVEPEPQEHRQSALHAPRDFFGMQAFLTVVIFSIFVITFIVQAFQIPSPSMENTLLIGDFLLVDKLHFAGNGGARHLLPYGSIKRGDIVVFYYPVDPSQFLVKRVIGLPGDHIRLRDRMVYVNGEPLHESYAIHKQWMPDGYRDNFPNQQGYSRDIDRHWRYDMPLHVSAGELVVPAGYYFVLGDNRDNSLDSRYWGFVPRANIIGRPLVIYLSVRGSEPDASNGKLIHSGQMAHLLQLARWNRIFRVVH